MERSKRSKHSRRSDEFTLEDARRDLVKLTVTGESQQDEAVEGELRQTMGRGDFRPTPHRLGRGAIKLRDIPHGVLQQMLIAEGRNYVLARNRKRTWLHERVITRKDVGARCA